MSMLSKVTRGAAASKKFRYLLSGNSLAMDSDRASEVSGPVAMITCPSSGIWVTSPSSTVMLGWERILSVMAAENASRSTASAPPASTRCSSAQAMMREPQRRSSSFSRPTAFSSWSERRELEHTSSPKLALWWAGLIFLGFISSRRTGMPRWASCQAASLPASPAPITITGSMDSSLCYWSVRPTR